mmetsp:Transcript_38631/g.67807  ORF Transcript_38631/g.67807 Transcript_38631/m.67807 type:complete len:125 (+) Transcript_38631:134-508(+)
MGLPVICCMEGVLEGNLVGFWVGSWVDGGGITSIITESGGPFVGSSVETLVGDAVGGAGLLVGSSVEALVGGIVSGGSMIGEGVTSTLVVGASGMGASVIGASDDGRLREGGACANSLVGDTLI